MQHVGGVDLGTVITIITNLVTVGVVYGTIKTRIDHMERDFRRLEMEIIDFRSIRSDLAVLKESLTTVRDKLDFILHVPKGSLGQEGK